MYRRLVRVAVTATAAGCLLVGSAGCSGKSDPPTPDPVPAPAQTGVISPAELKAIPDLKKADGILKDTTMTNCANAKGPVQAAGTVKNTAAKAKDLVVVVSWIVPKGSDVVARGIAVIKDAKAGSEHDWTVAADVQIDQQTQCVLSARRGTLSKA